MHEKIVEKFKKNAEMFLEKASEMAEDEETKNKLNKAFQDLKKVSIEEPIKKHE